MERGCRVVDRWGEVRFEEISLARKRSYLATQIGLFINLCLGLGVEVACISTLLSRPLNYSAR